MTTRDRLASLEAFGIKLGLDNMRTLVAALDHPERAYPTVHVAGTNGKGSVAAMVERALSEQGYRTGLYTSPHLDRIEERVAIAGDPIAGDAFDGCAREVFAAVDRERAGGRLAVTPTFFETTTAIAFEAFRRARVEVAVIEVGLGGRFDATNVIVPAASAITSIALDHERHLGTTLAAIAGEKAGIAKAGVPLVVGELPAEARDTIEAAARGAGAPLVPAAGALARVDVRDGRAYVSGAGRLAAFSPIRLSLAGRHQATNAETAVRLLEVLDARGVAVGGRAVADGLARARWPGRLEWLRLPSGGELLVDAAHNPAGAAALAAYLREAGRAPLAIALAAMRDKDVAGIVRPLAEVASMFVATEVPMARAHAARDLAAQVAACAPGVPVEAEPDPRRAVMRGLAGGCAAAAGSIYFIGPLRARLLESGAVSI